MEQPVTYCHILGHFILSKEKELQRAVQNASFGPKKTNNNKKKHLLPRKSKTKDLQSDERCSWTSTNSLCTLTKFCVSGNKDITNSRPSILTLTGDTLVVSSPMEPSGSISPRYQWQSSLALAQEGYQNYRWCILRKHINVFYTNSSSVWFTTCTLFLFYCRFFILFKHIFCCLLVAQWSVYLINVLQSSLRLGFISYFRHKLGSWNVYNIDHVKTVWERDLGVKYEPDEWTECILACHDTFDCNTFKETFA